MSQSIFLISSKFLSLITLMLLGSKIKLVRPFCPSSLKGRLHMQLINVFSKLGRILEIQSNRSLRPPLSSDHLSITTTIFRSHIRVLVHKWQLNNYHLQTTEIILGSQGWSLYTGLIVQWELLNGIRPLWSQSNYFLVFWSLFKIYRYYI